MTGHYFSNKIGLQEGKCKTKIADDKFVRKIEIIQKGEELVFFGYDVSANGKYIVVWETSLNPLLDKNKQFCLIEKKKKVLWCEKFENVASCHVSNNGMVVTLGHYYIPGHDINGKPANFNKDKLIITDKHKKITILEFNEKEEIMALAFSQNGKYLAYYLQKYRPTSNHLVLFDTEDNKTKWDIRCSKKESIRKLVFEKDLIHVYVGRKYGYTLTVDEDKITDNKETEKQNEKNKLDERKSELMGDAGRFLKKALNNLVPTIEFTGIIDHNSRDSSCSWGEIMTGKREIPAILISLYPVPDRITSNVQEKTEKQGYRFFLHIHVFAINAKDRDEITKKCIQRLTQQEKTLLDEGIIFEHRLHSRNIGFYPGSGEYFRADISGILIYPSNKNKSEVLRTRTWREIIELQSNESIIVKTDAYLKMPTVMIDAKLASSNNLSDFKVALPPVLGIIEAKLVITNKRLLILVLNPVSKKYRIFSPKKAKDAIIVGDDQKYIVHKLNLGEKDGFFRIYFKLDPENDFELFKRELEKLQEA